MVDRLLRKLPSSDGSGSLDRGHLMVVGVAASVLRLGWVAGTARPPAGLSDPILYQGFAIGIARGDGYVSISGLPTSYYPPGYPLTLGAIQRTLEFVGLGGSLHWGAGIAQALLGGLTAVLVAVAASRWCSPRVGMIAGLCLACWPNLIAYSSTLLSESLYLAVFAGFIAALAMTRPRQETGVLPCHPAADDHSAVGVVRRGGARLQWRGRWSSSVAASLLLGLTALVRPQVLLCLPALLIAEVLAGKWRAGIRLVTMLGVGALVVITPWFVRNLLVLDAPVLVSTNGGDNLCVGFHEGAPGFFSIPPACDTGEFYIDGPAAEIRRNDETARRARQWALAHLDELPALSIKKLWYTYRSDTDGLRAVEAYEQRRFIDPRVRRTLQLTSNAFYAVTMLAALLGSGVLGRRAIIAIDPTTRRTALWILSLTAAALFVPVIVFGDGRFKVPATPLLAVLAGVGIDALLRRRALRTSATANPGADRSG